ncbi:MAG: twitch domain-containing radical SAM protein [Bacteriovoracales bacterium]|nr:twitch domain-containing radical SAM protein [Bacteriovoracales bacterium]
MDDLETKRSTAIKKINSVSPCFCLAKWTQVTIHLQHGHTHSCHHPVPHHIPLEEIEKNPAALHNTVHKKKMRKMMLEGRRPPECDYCWKIEDSGTVRYSDRVVKSAEEWSIDRFGEVLSNGWENDISPSYLEVSFGHSCNFNCLYCFPDVSSTIYNDYKQNGSYPTIYRSTLEYNKENHLTPIPPNDPNPYVDAFWEWFPKIQNKLKVFRITGGEPLINPNTFKFLNYIVDNPMPKAEVAINSNLCVPEKNFQKFISSLDRIEIGEHVRLLKIYASVDTYGKHAEYIRHGLDYNLFLQRIEILLERYPSILLGIMCTFNAISVVSFKSFLKDLLKIKTDHCNDDKTYPPRLLLDTPYLRYPPHFTLRILPREFSFYLNDALDFIKANMLVSEGEKKMGFIEYELNSFERVCNWFHSLPREDDPEYHALRYDFYLAIQETDRRKNLSFAKMCPEYEEFLLECKNSNNKRSKEHQKKSDEAILAMKNYQKAQID